MATAFEQMFWALVKLCRERPRTALQRATVTATAPLRARVEGEDADAAVEPADGHVLTVGRKRVLLGGSSGGGGDTGWIDLSAHMTLSHPSFQYRIKDGQLHLRGKAWTSGAATSITAFTLPAGARPAQAIVAPAVTAQEVIGVWYISPAGQAILTRKIVNGSDIHITAVPPRPVD